MAFLQLVNEGDSLVWEPEQHFLLAGGGNATPVSPDMLGNSRLICLRRFGYSS
jgi:hypothetical protein